MKIHLLPRTESLESRRLLSNSFASVNGNGTLSVVGTSKVDSIAVRISGSKVQAILNGATESFTATSVKHIWIDGFGGNDKLANSSGLPSTLIGSTGNDSLVGGSGDDSLEGDDGTDTADYSTRSGNWSFATPYDVDVGPFDGTATCGKETDQINPDIEIYSGSPGNDSFESSAYWGANHHLPAFTLHGNGGDDTFTLGDGGHSAAFGDAGNDSFKVDANGNFPESCYGGDGDDTLYNGISYFDGGAGIDTLNISALRSGQADLSTMPNVENVTGAGGSAPGLIIGNSLANRIDSTGAHYPVTIEGEGGDDTLISGDQSDSLLGGSGNDSLQGNGGDDSLNGGDGNDVLVGGYGHDQLHGQDGNDVLYGKDGQTDTLDGGDGTDKASRDNSASVKDQVLSIESFI